MMQLGRVLEKFLNVILEEHSINRTEPEDFLVEFSTPMVAERILHSDLPPEAPFQLIWR